MVKLEWFNGKDWVECGEYISNHAAWVSLGHDNINYRTLDENGNVIMDTQVSST